MERWLRNSDNKIFDSEEDAFDDSIENEELELLIDTIIWDDLIPLNDLLRWAAGRDEFWDRFETQIHEARQRIFEDNYIEVDDEELEALGIIPT